MFSEIKAVTVKFFNQQGKMIPLINDPYSIRKEGYLLFLSEFIIRHFSMS